MEEVNKAFTPEFRNRLDKIVVFNHINNSMAINIARKELNLFKEVLLKKNVYMTFGEGAVEYVAKKGISKEFGAREIKRIINSQLKPLLVDEILFGTLSNGGNCIVDIEDNQFKLS